MCIKMDRTMKTHLFILIMFLYITTSCKKGNEDQPPQNIITHDTVITIYYKNYDPDTTIHLFSDSSFVLDVNNDSINDLKFLFHHWYEYFGPHAIDCYHLTVGGLNNTKLLINGHYCWGCDAPFDSTMYIHSTDSSKVYFPLFSSSIDWACPCFMEKNYIAFLLIKDELKYLGWVQLQTSTGPMPFYIDEYATLLSSSDSVRIGFH